MNRKLHSIAVVFFAAVSLGAGDRRVRLLPKLQSGQTLTYLIRFQSDKTVKTESKVVAPMAPDSAQLDAHGLLRVEILNSQNTASNPSIRARAQFLNADSDAAVNTSSDKSPDGNNSREDAAVKSIEFTISPDGSVNNTKRLDSLSPDQQQAWHQWVARFALAWTLPFDGMKPGEKSKLEQPEQSGAPIAGLHWERDSLYVRNEPCHSSQLSPTREATPSGGPADTCAVLLTTATLRQKSSSKDATPDDFKVHELRTMGSAKGTSETITYISLKTGLVVRATEETTQSMDVVIAKADGSNGVHFNVDAKSRAEVLLVKDTPAPQP
ncbi:MAG TPA: hypothetical protein VJO16_18190 [Candidatus Acidoferrum sp.]|nr:hypothetical protein [Candidatus Acidoferrum sp.]